MTIERRALRDRRAATGRGDFIQNMRWVSAHQGGSHAGEWVALCDGQLIDHDKSRRALYARLSEQGKCEDVLLVQVPRERLIFCPE